MTRPLVTKTAEETYVGLGPWTRPDEQQGWHLLHLVQALTARLDALNEVVRDGDTPGWSSVVDVNRAAPEGLGWLSQFVGVDLPDNINTEAKRQALRTTSGFRLGTPLAIAGASQKYLTGTKAVQIVERDGGPYRFTVRTFLAETPDQAAVLSELKKAKPAGLLMQYQVISGQTYDELEATGDTYSELSAEYATYFDMSTSVPPTV